MRSTVNERRQVERELRNAVGVPLVLLGVLAVLLIYLVSDLVDAMRLVEHTNDAIVRAQELDAELVTMESGVRGYLISGDPGFLAGYERARAGFPAALGLLRDWVADSPEQQNRIDALVPLYDDWNTFAVRTLETRRAGGDYAGLVASGAGLRAMQALRSQLAAFEAAEQARRERRKAAAARLVRFVFVGSVGLTLLLAVVLALVSRRQVRSVVATYAAALEEAIERDRALHEAEERAAREYRGLFENANDAIIVFDPDGEIVLDVNERACELYGRSRDDFLGMSLEAISVDVAAGQERVRETLEAHSRVKFESIQRHADGSELIVDVTASVVTFQGRRAIVSINRDVTERRRAAGEIRRLNAELETRVAERTAELEAANRGLERANAELEAFSYSVSHDLRAPLRAIDGFSRILLEDYGSTLPEDASELLGVVRHNASQMGELIDDLLQFSRLSRLPLRKQTVDLGALVRAALEDQKADLAGRNVEIRVDDLPTCHGDPVLLKQVVANLLSNAVKYSRHRDAARIMVRGRVDDEAHEAIYEVADNGAGFDMRYVAKLFGVFQRLHRAEDYEGTGVGLAIVHRVVTRHGGRVWAEGEVDAGATFSFALPLETIDDRRAC